MDAQEWRMREAAQRQQAVSARHLAMAQQQAAGLQVLGQYEALGRQGMNQLQSFTMGNGYMVQQPGTIGSTGQAAYGSVSQLRGLTSESAKRPIVKFKKRYRFHSHYSKIKEQIENTKRSVIS